MRTKTDYNSIARSYNERYTVNYLRKIEDSLLKISSDESIFSILEVGCGTGRWLNAIYDLNKNVFGLDYSFKMLSVATENNKNINLVNADASFVPFRDESFDMIFCINAIHHFPDKEAFFQNAYNLLRNNGIVCIYGVDPHIDKDWYVYEYFDKVYENDLKRFPSLKTLTNLCHKYNFKIAEQIVVEKIYIDKIGKDVFSDPFIKKNMNSQLANLSDEEYQSGIEKIKQQIKNNPETSFLTDIKFYLTKAIKKGE